MDIIVRVSLELVL